jgi:hypothetical protein
MSFFLSLVIPNFVNEARAFGFLFTPDFGVNGQKGQHGPRRACALKG